jgi:hypothetical protein
LYIVLVNTDEASLRVGDTFPYSPPACSPSAVDKPNDFVDKRDVDLVIVSGIGSGLDDLGAFLDLPKVGNIFPESAD